MMKKIFAEQPAPPWTMVGAMGAVGMAFAALILGSTVGSIFIRDTVLALFVGWSIGMALIVGLVFATRGRTPPEIGAMRVERTPANLPVIAVFALGMAITLDLLSWVIVGDKALASAELIRLIPSEAEIGTVLTALAFVLLLQPLAEELIFRGVLFPSLSAALGGGFGLFGTALIYGIFHALAYAPPPDHQTVFLWYGFLLPILDGIIFTAIRAATASTRASSVAHAVFGVFALLKVLALAA